MGAGVVGSKFHPGAASFRELSGRRQPCGILQTLGDSVEDLARAASGVVIGHMRFPLIPSHWLLAVHIARWTDRQGGCNSGALAYFQQSRNQFHTCSSDFCNVVVDFDVPTLVVQKELFFRIEMRMRRCVSVIVQAPKTLSPGRSSSVFPLQSLLRLGTPSQLFYELFCKPI